MKTPNIAVIMKWLSGSGKSTLCRESLLPKWYKIFSRDTTREENQSMKEKQIASLEDKFIKDNIWNNIVIDNTHMNVKTRENLIAKLNYLWYKIEIIDMRADIETKEEYLLRSLERNSKREWIKRVPDSVIYQQYLQEYGIDWPVVICDIDWTVADLTHRLHFIKQEKKDHDSFYVNVGWDLPITQTIAVVQALKKQWYTIVMMSWRRNQCCQDTISWLNKYEVPFDFILMRSWRDHRQDFEIKEELYERCLKNSNILLAIDDRKQIVDLWRSLWIFVMDVRQTDTIF